jgi:hypothetical protein
MGPQNVNVDGGKVEEIIHDLKKSPKSMYMNAGFDDTPDACQRLFDYLCTEEGRQVPIEWISMRWRWDHPVGDVRIEDITRYLTGNQVIRRLYFGEVCGKSPRAIAKLLTSFSSGAKRQRLYTLLSLYGR